MVESRSRSELSKKLAFYSNQVDVDSVANQSSQASVYLGREVDTRANVVVKQYKAQFFRGLTTEIKVLTLLEKMRNG